MIFGGRVELGEIFEIDDRQTLKFIALAKCAFDGE
jgi:hypothetical protein